MLTKYFAVLFLPIGLLLSLGTHAGEPTRELDQDNPKLSELALQRATFQYQMAIVLEGCQSPGGSQLFQAGSCSVTKFAVNEDYIKFLSQGLATSPRESLVVDVVDNETIPGVTTLYFANGKEGGAVLIFSHPSIHGEPTFNDLQAALGKTAAGVDRIRLYRVITR